MEELIVIKNTENYNKLYIKTSCEKPQDWNTEKCKRNKAKDEECRIAPQYVGKAPQELLWEEEKQSDKT